MKTGRGAAGLLILFEIVVLITVSVLGIAKGLGPKSAEVSTEGLLQNTENIVQAATGSTVVAETEAESPADIWNAEITATEGFSEEVLQQLSAMTTAEKVAQMFLVSPEALTENAKVTIAGEGTRRALQEYPVGGLVYSQNNYQGRQQMLNLLSGAQRYSGAQGGVQLIFALADERLANGLAFSDLYEADSLVAAVEAVRNNAEATEWENVKPAVEYSRENPTDIAFLSYENLLVSGVLTNEEEAVNAVKAGADFLYATENFRTLYDAVLAAAEEGSIATERLDNAVGHILMRKAAMPAPQE